MSMSIRLIAPALAFAAAISAAPARAAPPAPYYDVSGTLKYLEPGPNGNNVIQTLNVTGLGTFSTNPNGTTISPATLNVGATPSPYLQLQTTGGYNDHKATIRYSYRVFLESIANAPATITALATVSGMYDITTSNGPSTVTARTAIYADMTGDVQTFSRSLFAPMPASQSFSLTGAGALLEAGYVLNGISYDVYGGNLSLSLSTLAYGAGRAFIDPMITPNATGVQNAGYALNGALVQVPGGFGNPGVPAPVFGVTPEPAQWALLIGGFGLIGGMARRRRAIDEDRRDLEVASALTA